MDGSEIEVMVRREYQSHERERFLGLGTERTSSPRVLDDDLHTTFTQAAESVTKSSSGAEKGVPGHVNLNLNEKITPPQLGDYVLTSSNEVFFIVEISTRYRVGECFKARTHDGLKELEGPLRLRWDAARSAWRPE